MPDSSSVPPHREPAAADTYAPYGQLLKMVLPSSGSVALYDAANELLWTSDAFERPDLRALLDDLGAAGAERRDEHGCIEIKKGGVHAFVAPLRGEENRPLGALVVEAGSSSRYTVSMVSSLLKPVLDCLVNRMNLERTVARAEAPDPRSLDLLLSVDEFDRDDATALKQLLRHSVAQLGASFGALLVPDKHLAVTESADPGLDDGRVLDRTRKNLLAWAELNNRPMIVNKVGAAGGAAPFKILACPLRDVEGRVIGLAALFRGARAPDFELRDVRIFEFVGRKAVAILASQHDPLTGLVNRLIFERRAQALVDEPEGAGHRALLYVDIDRLQAVNNAFGYSAGDEVIRCAAEILRATADDGLVTRLDGDRFAVLLPPAGSAAAEQRAAAIGAELAGIGYTNGEAAVTVGASIGATFVEPGTTVAHAIATAELACKRAKGLGPNRVEWSGTEAETLFVARKRRLLAARSLEEAIRTNQFRLDAQAVVGLRARRAETIGYELLVRMRSPAGEDLAPDKFFDAAERYELMPALDRWVLSSAVETLKPMLGPAGLPYTLMINVSAQSVAAGKFPEFALEQLAAAGLPAAAFCFELGEAAAVGQLGAAERFIRELAAGGCKLALDDFGCGLSSLAHLKQLPVHYLKIDGRFVRRVDDDRIAESIVSGIAKAGRTLGVGVVAEHVETEAVAARLAELDVDWGQGFHLGRPQPLADVAAGFGGGMTARERRTAGS